MERFYLPILKAKGGEFTALVKLNFSIKSWVFPLFEITQVEYDNETNSKAPTLEKHLDSLCKKIKKCWPYDHSFIDIGLVKDENLNNESPFEYIYRSLDQDKIYPMPIIRIDLPITAINGLKNISRNYSIRNIGIRITIEDIDSPNFENDLMLLLGNINFTPDKCHLIFDLMDSNFSETENFSDSIVGILERFPGLSEWRTFTLAGGAFPITGKLKEGFHEVVRGDWKLFKAVSLKMRQLDIIRPINYGDYSMIAPGHFIYDPVTMQTSANIRYTHNDVWLVVKGKSLKITGYDQYFTQSAEIVSSNYYHGENYSEGDKHLYNCSIRNTKTGNAQVWKWVGNNHHITKVVNDLFANPSAS